MNKVRQLKDKYLSSDFEKNFFYEGNDLGAVISNDRTFFKLWSPLATSVYLNLYHEGNDSPSYAKIPMIKASSGVWEHEAKENLHGTYYDYTLIFEDNDTSVISADPYAKGAGVNGIRSMAVDFKRVNPGGWESDIAPYNDKEDFIYEIHVKDFSWDKSGGFPKESRGKYAALSYPNTTLNNDGVHPTGIAHLSKLGVNCIQLMPVYDYGSVDEARDFDNASDEQFNWGYDPVNYNVPEGSYSSNPYDGSVRITELKEAILSLHQNGFKVIMDVVYNHTYSLDSCLQRTVPWYFYRADKDGNASNGSACGEDIASEMPMCNKYIRESVLFWVKEYHIDGFRFDLMGLLDTKLMNDIRHDLDECFGKDQKLLYGEPWAADKTFIEKGRVQSIKKNFTHLNENIGMFSDDIRDSIKGSVFELDEPGFVNGGEDFETSICDCLLGKYNKDVNGNFDVAEPSRIISYVSSHDNQTLFDKLSETTKDKEKLIKQYKLAAGIYLTMQGRPFMLSGEDFGRTKGGNENSFDSPIEVNRVDWMCSLQNAELSEYYRGLIALRKCIPGLCDKDKGAQKRIEILYARDGVVSFFVNNKESEISRWKRILVVYNSSNRDFCVGTLVDSARKWELLVNETSSLIWQERTQINETMNAAPCSALIMGQLD